jgi:dTDP-glucose 4,6-dehydratase
MSSTLPPLPQEDLDHVLLHTRDLWETARGQRFFITGGTGVFRMWLFETCAHIKETIGFDVPTTILIKLPGKYFKFL